MKVVTMLAAVTPVEITTEKQFPFSMMLTLCLFCPIALVAAQHGITDVFVFFSGGGGGGGEGEGEREGGRGEMSWRMKGERYQNRIESLPGRPYLTRLVFVPLLLQTQHSVRTSSGFFFFSVVSVIIFPGRLPLFLGGSELVSSVVFC